MQLLLVGFDAGMRGERESKLKTTYMASVGNFWSYEISLGWMERLDCIERKIKAILWAFYNRLTFSFFSARQLDTLSTVCVFKYHHSKSWMGISSKVRKSQMQARRESRSTCSDPKGKGHCLYALTYAISWKWYFPKWHHLHFCCCFKEQYFQRSRISNKWQLSMYTTK